MSPITVVDARMGRGKSSAAIRYMNENRGSQRFLYITPFLCEVDRICEQCDFDQPDSDEFTKLSELKRHLRAEHNISSTHSLFYLLDDEALAIAADKHYSLIVDESINTIKVPTISTTDLDMMKQHLINVDDNGKISWKTPDYTGQFFGYKRAADAGSLFMVDGTLMQILDPNKLRAFDKIFMLTYLFNGQYQKGYLDSFGFQYDVIGIDRDAMGYRFSDYPDCPPPVDYSSMIHIVDNYKMNSPGDRHFALSKNWYMKHGYASGEIKALRNGMHNFFQNITKSDNNERLWTCFMNSTEKLIDRSSGRYRRNFLQMSSRATNAYRDKTSVAYMVNRFTDANIKKFFYKHGCVVDEDTFALSEMIQWIWRSAIRDDKPISLYIPSARMRTLLTDWISSVREGGEIIC